ncbi:MAG: hypothetical protein ABI330_16485, partial [Caldimonas sp.]
LNEASDVWVMSSLVMLEILVSAPDMEVRASTARPGSKGTMILAQSPIGRGAPRRLDFLWRR